MNILAPDEIDFSAYLKETEARQRVRPAAEYIRELTDQLGRPIKVKGQPLPWLKTRGYFRFRPGEVTLWAGVNGHGKSLMSGFVSLDLMAMGQKVCIASFEMKPHSTLKRMIRQWCGYPSDDEFSTDPEATAAMRDLYEQFGILADSRLWFYDQQGTVSSNQMIAVARYCAKELGIQHLFIDSLMKCVRGTDDYNAQKNFVDELTAIARDHDMHIHLVHHIRKLENEMKRPDKTDVKGAGEITDQVDNVLLVWRNKAEGNAKKDADPDALLICCKQRHGEWEGGINLWFDRDSQQYTETKGGSTIDFCARSA
jgi:twinkle protein